MGLTNLQSILDQIDLSYDEFIEFCMLLGCDYCDRVKDLKPIDTKESDLLSAMKMIIKTGKGPKIQVPSMGCNIKWIK